MLVTELNKDLYSLIAQCSSHQQHGFYQQLKRIRTDKSSEPTQKLAARIDQSIRQVEKRQSACPTIDYPDLPISDKRGDISALIEHNQVVILCGETGSGKTTQLPKICLLYTSDAADE